MSVTSKGGAFPIVLDMQRQGVKKSFQNASEIADFLNEEVQKWSEIATRVPNVVVGRTDFVSLAGRSASTQAVGRISATTDIDSCIGVLEAYDAERPVVLQGKIGRLVMDWDQETPAEISGTLWAAASLVGTPKLTNIVNNPATMRDLSAVIYGQAKVADGLRQLRSERSLIEQLTSELNDQIAAAKERNLQTEEQLTTSSQELRRITDAHNASTADLLKAAEGYLNRSSDQALERYAEILSNFDAKIKESVEEIEKFKKKVRIDVGLEEPTNFWNKKANGHRLSALISGVIFLVVVAGMVLWIDSSAVGLVADAVDRIVGDRSSPALSLVPIAFITVPALAFAWILRHISRVIIQNLSLEADARLRGTITQTFKSLAADRAMNDAELAIALQALFRPIDGKDHSEISPPSLADLLKLGDSKPL